MNRELQEHDYTWALEDVVVLGSGRNTSHEAVSQPSSKEILEGGFLNIEKASLCAV